MTDDNDQTRRTWRPADDKSTDDARAVVAWLSEGNGRWPVLVGTVAVVVVLLLLILS